MKRLYIILTCALLFPAAMHSMKINKRSLNQTSEAQAAQRRACAPADTATDIKKTWECEQEHCPFYGKAMSPAEGSQHIINQHTEQCTCQYLRCDRSFTRYQTLKEHVNKHSGYQPYRCSDCEKTFPIFDDKRRHIDLVHRNVQLFACHFCEIRKRCVGGLEGHFKSGTCKDPRANTSRTNHSNVAASIQEQNPIQDDTRNQNETELSFESLVDYLCSLPKE